LLFFGRKRAFSDGEQAKLPVLPGSKTGGFAENFVTGGRTDSEIEAKRKPRQKIDLMVGDSGAITEQTLISGVQSKRYGGATHINANSFTITLPNTIHKSRKLIRKR